MRIFRSPYFFRLLLPGVWKTDAEVIYMTFDDGPDPNITPWVLSTLKKYNIQATFFCVGKNAETHGQLLDLIKQDGHRIGNHTYAHENGRKTKNEFYAHSVEKAGFILKSKLFRPPYGSIKRSQLKILGQKGYKVIFWSWLSYDFDASVKPETIINKAKTIRNGDILVFHDSQKAAFNLKNSLEEVIFYLSNKGFKFGLIPI